jgi:hypothetical protein
MGDATTKRCAKCGEVKEHASFARDASRADGLTYWCQHCRNNRARTNYTPKPGERFGPKPAPARSGDKRQARKRVNQLVKAGKIPHPKALPCHDCGHIFAIGERRHEYDHYLGYSAEHHRDVQPVCTSCHAQRERRRKIDG